MKKWNTIFLLGGPGCGKGTQSKLIQQKFNFIHLSAGQLLRTERSTPGSKYGHLIESTIVNGKIVPSFITVDLLQKAMKLNQSKSHKFLIDGFPRNLQNLNAWNSQMSQNTQSQYTLHLVCSQQQMIKRVKERSQKNIRSDDDVEIIKKRFKTYESQTMEVIQSFKKIGKLKEINANQNIQNIFKDICQFIQNDPLIVK